MEEVSVKRERESEEDANERTAKALLATDKVVDLNNQYMELSKRERLQWFNVGSSSLPLPLQQIIATTDAGVLMTLAQMSPLFLDLTRQEWVWREMFRRDYPSDFEFCRGKVPFFVLSENHPFYNGQPIHGNAWKRYYLHIANNYRRCVEDFSWIFRVPPAGFHVLDLKTANAKQVYRWAHAMLFNKHIENFFDRRAFIAWHFVCLFVAITNPNGIYQNQSQIALDYWNYAKNRSWMWKYLAFCNPDPANRVKRKLQILQAGPSLFSYYDGFTPPISDRSFQSFVELIPDGENNAQKWNEMDFFSSSDRGHFQSFLTAQRMSANFAAFENVADETRQDIVTQAMVCWDILRDCYRIPCISSFHMSVRFGAFSLGVYMTRESSFVSQKVDGFLDELGAALLDLDFHLNRRDNSIFPTRDLNDRFDMLCNPFKRFSLPFRSMMYGDVYHLLWPGIEWSVRGLFGICLDYPRVDSLPNAGKIRYLQSCIQCGVQPAVPQQCGGTCSNKKAIYCGTECQLKHWMAGHQKECRKKK